MRIYVNRTHDNSIYNGRVTQALKAIGATVTHDLQDKFDDAVMCHAYDAPEISPRCRGYNKFDLCDKFWLVERQAQIGLNPIPTIVPRSVGEIVDFMRINGTSIVKPRCGSGSASPNQRYDYFYSKFDSSADLLEEVNLDLEFFDRQNSTPYTSEDHAGQVVLQKYTSLDTEDAYQFYARGFVDTVGKYHPEVYHQNYAVVNENRDRYKVGLVTHNQPVFGKSKDVIGLPSGIEEKIEAYADAFCNSIITSSVLQLGGSVINGEISLFDISLAPSAITGVLTDRPYLEDQMSFLYGQSSEIKYKQNVDFNVWYTSVNMPMGGATQGFVDLLKEFGGYRLYPRATFGGSERLQVVFTGVDREACIAQKKAYEEVIQDLA